MKAKLKLLGYCILLTLHVVLVYFVPGLPWYFVVKHGHNLGFILMAIITVCLQIPLMIYATIKDNGVMARLIIKIRMLNDIINKRNQ